MKKLIQEEMEGVLGSLDMENLTDEEKQELIQDAKRQFDEIPGVIFDNIVDDDEKNLNNDYNKTREVLTRNIDRLEKLTQICVNAVALDNANIGMLQTTMSVLSEQNKSLKLLSELQGKLFLNKQQAKKMAELDNPTDKPNQGLPDGWVVK